MPGRRKKGTYCKYIRAKTGFEPMFGIYYHVLQTYTIFILLGNVPFSYMNKYVS